MDALSGSHDDRVQLIGFNIFPSSPSSRGRFLSHRREESITSIKSTESHLKTSLTITANGRVSPRRYDSLPSPISNKVKLIKFLPQKEDSLEDEEDKFLLRDEYLSCALMDQPLNNKESGRRLESMERLQQESHDWFSKVREENHKWRTGFGASGDVGSMVVGCGVNCGGSFKERKEDRMHKFFEEAQKKLSQGNQELFTKFMLENKDRFSKLLGNSDTCSIFHELGGGNRPTSLYSDPDNVLLGTHIGSCNTRNNSSTDSPSLNEKGSTKLRPTKSFKSGRSPKDGAENEDSQGNGIEGTGESRKSFRKGKASKNGDFTTNGSDGGSSNITNFLSSPIKVSCCPARIANAHYQMSRSTFEYCGITNTYKFCTEHVSRSGYGNGYESISESEDEEDDDLESVEDTNSTVGTVSELEEEETSVLKIEANRDSGCPLSSEYELKKEKSDKVQQTLHKIAHELLTTERTYVSILSLLDQVFAFRVDQENRVHHMFPQEVVSQMFCNLKSLYKLHHDFLLPLLEERLQNWDEELRIGDIMKNFAPFLKMYTEYVKNYDNAMGLINSWYLKQPHFAQIMDDIHRTEECGHLTLQHHMLTPVQRVPRYQLLLKDYLKRMPENSPDKADTEKALELVSTAAIHANDAMKKNEKIKKLLEIQELIGGVVDLVSPSRELQREGKIIKISARSGDHQERHLFLFNDLLLLCSQRRIANRVVSGPIFRVRARLEVDGLTVEEGDNLETANSFYLRHVGRIVELYTQTLEEKQAWMEAFAKAVHELTRRKSSLRSAEGLELGKRAPTFIKVESVTHCMSCGTHFNTFSFKWKHHCHACGIVACSKCLVHKLPLPCEKFRSSRVCRACYETISASMSPGEVSRNVNLTSDDLPVSTPDSPPVSMLFESPESPIRHRSVLDIRPHDPAVICGYLQLKARSRTWVRRWFALHSDFVLYSFNNEEDERALTSMPVPGYSVSQPLKGESGLDGRDHVLKLTHQKKVYFFQAADSIETERWLNCLERASKAETLS